MLADRLSGAQQNLDAAVMRELRVVEGAQPDLLIGHAGLHQCGPYRSGTSVAQSLIARIRRAVEPDLEGRVGGEIGCDIRYAAAIGSANVRPAGIEAEGAE